MADNKESPKGNVTPDRTGWSIGVGLRWVAKGFRQGVDDSVSLLAKAERAAVKYAAKQSSIGRSATDAMKKTALEASKHPEITLPGMNAGTKATSALEAMATRMSNFYQNYISDLRNLSSALFEAERRHIGLDEAMEKVEKTKKKGPLGRFKEGFGEWWKGGGDTFKTAKRGVQGAIATAGVGILEYARQRTAFEEMGATKGLNIKQIEDIGDAASKVADELQLSRGDVLDTTKALMQYGKTAEEVANIVEKNLPYLAKFQAIYDIDPDALAHWAVLAKHVGMTDDNIGDLLGKLAVMREKGVGVDISQTMEAFEAYATDLKTLRANLESFPETAGQADAAIKNSTDAIIAMHQAMSDLMEPEQVQNSMQKVFALMNRLVSDESLKTTQAIAALIGKQPQMLQEEIRKGDWAAVFKDMRDAMKKVREMGAGGGDVRMMDPFLEQFMLDPDFARALSDKAIDQYDDIFQSIQDAGKSDLDRIFDVWSKTLGGWQEKLQSMYTKFGGNLGKMIVEPLRRVGEAVLKFREGHKDAFDSAEKGFTLLTAAVAGLGVAITGAKLLWKFTGLQVGFRALGALAAGTVSVLGPVGAGLVALAAAVGGIVLAYQNWDSIQPVLDKFLLAFGDLESKLYPILDRMKDRIASSLRADIETLFPQTKGFFALKDWMMGEKDAKLPPFKELFGPDLGAYLEKNATASRDAANKSNMDVADRPSVTMPDPREVNEVQLAPGYMSRTESLLAELVAAVKSQSPAPAPAPRAAPTPMPTPGSPYGDVLTDFRRY